MMERFVGVRSIGIRCPIIIEGDNLREIVVDAILNASKTESIVARAEGNYATVDQIAKDIKNKFPSGEISVVFPITSRNRFAIILKAIARDVKKIYLMFFVHLMKWEMLF